MSQPRRPRLAVVVANGITGDSRVQKSAIAAARAGWDVALLGVAADGLVSRSMMGPIRVSRVVVPAYVRTSANAHPWRSALTQFGIGHRTVLPYFDANYRAAERRTTARIGDLRAAARNGGPGAAAAVPARLALTGGLKVRRAVHQLRRRAFLWEQRQKRAPAGTWYKDWPQLVDLDNSLGPAIERIRPDVIHANDITTIGVVAQAVSRMRARGETVRWLYDAHEFVPGVDWPSPHQRAAYLDLEESFIRRADTVVTVSPEIADRIRQVYALRQTPRVVRNTPVRACVGRAPEQATVREVCGLDPDTPLLVYSGWISAERGLGSAVGALALLPDFHLAIVAGRSHPELDGLLVQAEDAGVADRVHVVPYVAQHTVADYLSSADIGLICSKRTLNYELSLPTKMAEYLHAGLPVIVSDVKAASAFVHDRGVGEVFTAGDPASLVTAIRAVMADRDGRRAQITDSLLDELSWEKQTEVLLEVYQALSPLPAPAPRPDLPWGLEEGARVSRVRTGDGTGEEDAEDEEPPVEAPAVTAHWRKITPESRIRLGLGPANYAGQGAAFASAICRRRPDVGAEVVMWRQPESFDYPADEYLDVDCLPDADVQAQRMKSILERYTHVLADAFLPVFGHLYGSAIDKELPILRRAGIKTAILAHGSEIRHPLHHMDRHKWSMFRDAPAWMVENLTGRVEQNLKIVAAGKLPVYVTTPDLLADVPTATWVPLVVDVAAWASDEPVMRRPRPMVLHAPSKRWTKGTDHILPVVEELERKGMIELVLAENVPWAQVRDLVQRCDIVLDQFTTGSFGTFAVEAMAAGRPVLGHITEEVAAVVGADLPIVNVGVADLGGAIEQLVSDRDRAAALGAASAAYARTFHDGAMTARILTDFLS
ncbi:hypothetical protein GCM10010124_18050 [Pilimelia terevasa]|uniref:Glycosyltransferase n=1 Tax=Pilimelia terevasa TaxID=53372 RepID=A0A8J3FGQ9_9ACTN|nr:glycosyltransferase [Pilimelia terevasa]GGK25914.1 hypothetical protein GCM10010124_18050 [Pilimelia terevasa]